MFRFIYFDYSFATSKHVIMLATTAKSAESRVAKFCSTLHNLHVGKHSTQSIYHHHQSRDVRRDTTVLSAPIDTSILPTTTITMSQDMPPKGGYQPVQYKVGASSGRHNLLLTLQRNLPAKGFRPGILLLGAGAVMGFGWYKLIGGIREAK